MVKIYVQHVTGTNDLAEVKPFSDPELYKLITAPQ
jgi:hypothetical protein